MCENRKTSFRTNPVEFEFHLSLPWKLTHGNSGVSNIWSYLIQLIRLLEGHQKLGGHGQVNMACH